MKLTGIESNLWKYFLVNLTSRRQFIPILSVYFLTLPHAQANQIGLYTGCWYLASMLMQMPAGVIADRYGQKNALIISKVFLILSSASFIFANGFWSFVVGAVCMALGSDAFNSGISNVFLKKSLEILGRGDDYRKVASKISGNVALISIFFIIGLPLLTGIDIRLPLVIGWVLDIIGLFIVFSLYEVHEKPRKEEHEGIISLMRQAHTSGFLSYALFAGVIGGFLFADNAFRSPYLVSLGYPLSYIGLVMGGSRLVWWLVGRYITLIERYISFSKLLISEIILFPLYYIGASSITNPWMLGILFSVVIGWFWGRNEIYTDVLMNRIQNERHRSTLLSVKSQISGFVQVTIAFAITGIMGYSYVLGFQILGVIMFFVLGAIYWFGIRENQKE